MKSLQTLDCTCGYMNIPRRRAAGMGDKLRNDIYEAGHLCKTVISKTYHELDIYFFELLKRKKRLESFRKST